VNFILTMLARINSLGFRFINSCEETSLVLSITKYSTSRMFGSFIKKYISDIHSISKVNLLVALCYSSVFSFLSIPFSTPALSSLLLLFLPPILLFIYNNVKRIDVSLFLVSVSINLLFFLMLLVITKVHINIFLLLIIITIQGFS
jgi:hypothetical protein